MKARIRKLIAALLVICLIMYCDSSGSKVKAASQSWTSGDCTVTWDGADTLTVSGNGAMADYSSSSPAPWADTIDSVKYIVVNEGVTRIGNYAFKAEVVCDSITLPKSLQSVGGCAFTYYDITTIKFIVPDDFTMTLTSRGKEILSANGELYVPTDKTSHYNSVSIPEDGKGICPEFSLAPMVTKISFNSLTKIESGAFQCTNIKSLYIPYGVTTIGSTAFKGCMSLKGIVFTDKVDTIEYGAFSECRALESIYFGYSTRIIGSWSFSNCGELKSITFSDRLQKIESGAFNNTKISCDLVFPNQIES